MIKMKYMILVTDMGLFFFSLLKSLPYRQVPK